MGSVPYPDPQMVFAQQYEAVRRDEIVGVLLAVFLGCFGIHHFYVGRTGLGILYCCFFWTGIPAILGVIECFFMPGRVRQYNAMQAAGLAAAMGIPIPGYLGYPGWVAPGYAQGYAPGAGAGSGAGYAAGYTAGPAYAGASMVVADPATLVACANCGNANPAGVRFCSKCGTQVG